MPSVHQRYPSRLDSLEQHLTTCLVSTRKVGLRSAAEGDEVWRTLDVRHVVSKREMHGR